MWGTYELLTFKIIIHCCYYLCTCRYVVVEFYPWFKFCYPLFETHYHTFPYRKTMVKLITNRWAWKLVPTKLVEPGNALAMRRRYPWQPCERPPPGTVTLNNSVEYLPTNTNLALTSGGRKGWEKPKNKMAH